MVPRRSKTHQGPSDVVLTVILGGHIYFCGNLGTIIVCQKRSCGVLEIVHIVKFVNK